MSGAAAGLGVRPYRSFIRRAALRKINNEHIEPIRKWHIVKGDLVFLRSGRDAGKTGKVKAVLRRQNRVLVEGVNFVKRHLRAGETGQAGGVVAMESPVHYSNVNLVDPTTGKPTRIAIRYNESGEKLRVAKKSGSVIPWPEILKLGRAVRPADPGPRDTPVAAATKVTYVPPAELVPYLSASGELFRIRKSGAEDAVPSIVRNKAVGLRKKNRNRILARWQRALERRRVAEAVEQTLAEQLGSLPMAADAAAAAGGAPKPASQVEMR